MRLFIILCLLATLSLEAATISNWSAQLPTATPNSGDVILMQKGGVTHYFTPNQLAVNIATNANSVGMITNKIQDLNGRGTNATFAGQIGIATNLWQLLGTNGLPLVFVNSNQVMTVSNTLVVSARPQSTTTVPLTLAGSQGQDANLLDVKDYLGNVLFAISYDGTFTDPRLASPSIAGALWTATDLIGNGAWSTNLTPQNLSISNVTAARALVINSSKQVTNAVTTAAALDNFFAMGITSIVASTGIEIGTNGGKLVITNTAASAASNAVANLYGNATNTSFYGIVTGETVRATNILDPGNVKYWGAIGDGTNDDTSAIQVTLKRGGDVFFPKGSYVVNARSNTIADVTFSPELVGLLVTNNTRLWFESGAQLITKSNGAANYITMCVYGSTNVEIHGGTVIGDNNPAGARAGEFGYGLAIFNSSNVRVYNFTSISNWGDGVFIDANLSVNTDATTQVAFTDCAFIGNRRNNVCIANASSVTFTRCSMIGASGTAPQAGVDIEPEVYAGNTNSVSRDIRFDNCTVANNASSGIVIWTYNNNTYVRGVSVQNCLISSNGNYGMLLSGTNVAAISIVGCQLVNNVTAGMTASSIKAPLIINSCVVTNNGEQGIQLNALSGAVVSCSFFSNNRYNGGWPAGGNHADVELQGFSTYNSISGNNFFNTESAKSARFHVWAVDSTAFGNSIIGNGSWFGFSAGTNSFNVGSYNSLVVADTTGSGGVGVGKSYITGGTILDVAGSGNYDSNLTVLGSVGVGTRAPSSAIDSTGQVRSASAIITNTISAPTNTANFTLVTNNFSLDTYYTNSGARAWVSVVIGMTNILATEKSHVALYLDQDGDGSWERTGISVRAQGVIALAVSEQLSSFIQPSGRFIFTNLGTVANASIEANSSQWVRQ